MSDLVGFDPYREIAGIGHNGGPKLRYYQEEAVDSLFEYFNTHGGTNPDGTPVKANPLICLPTGTGKSLVIAEFIRRVMMQFPNQRVLMATHVKELISQNASKMLEAWPLAPLGIVSAGLGRREYNLPIVFGGVQSLVKKFSSIGWRDLLVIDEAHLLANEGSYSQLINELTNVIGMNPYLKVIGLTATPYRLGLGLMTNGNIFTDICYNLCNIDGFARLIAEGFLCPLIPKKTVVELDISNVGKTADDYNQKQLQEAVDKETVTFAALKECVESAYDRACWLMFASGIEHAEHIAEMLNSAFGISAVAIHSKKSDGENAANMLAWKSGQVRAAVSMNSLTTGVDNPMCDFIGMLRPTMSPGLWVQMLGRGTRPYPGKQNCLVLDFAGNTRRLGPINDPVIPRMKGQGTPGDAPVKVCGACGTYNHATAKVCIVCGADFTFAEKLNRHSSGMELLRSDLPQIERFPVSHVVMKPHTSKAGNNVIQIAYFCGLRTFFEYQNVEAKGNFMRHKSRDWFRQRYHYNTRELTWDNDVPATNAEILKLAHELRKPQFIQVWVNKERPEIVGYEF